MANTTSKDMGLSLDNASGSLTDISNEVNSQALARAINLLQDTAIGDGEHTRVPGVGEATLTLNGYINSTTHDIFAPLYAQNTSATKTAQFDSGIGAKQYINGEFWVGDVEITGDVDELQTWSATLSSEGALNNTGTSL